MIKNSLRQKHASGTGDRSQYRTHCPSRVAWLTKCPPCGAAEST